MGTVSPSPREQLHCPQPSGEKIKFCRPLIKLYYRVCKNSTTVKGDPKRRSIMNPTDRNGIKNMQSTHSSLSSQLPVKFVKNQHLKVMKNMAEIAAILCLAVCVYDMNKAGLCGTTVSGSLSDINKAGMCGRSKCFYIMSQPFLLSTG